MALRDLRYFIAIAEHGSIVRAAAAMRVAQPALSRRLHDLEELVGTALVERGRRGVTLTPVGAALLAMAREYCARADESVLRARQAAEGTRGRVRLALGRVSMESAVVERALVATHRCYPDIQIDVSEMESSQIATALRSRDMDIGITLTDFLPDDDVKQDVLYHEVIDSAIVAASHPLAGAGTISIRELCAEPLIFLPPGPGPAGTVVRALTKAGATQMEKAPSLDHMLAMVASGRGWSVIPRSLTRQAPPGTSIVHFRDFDVRVPMVIGWVHQRDAATALNVVQSLRRHAGDRNGSSAAGPAAAAPQAASSGKQSTLDPRLLRTFAMAADERSLSRAALRLNLTQSGVSRQVRALEREVGVELLRRVGHGVVCTPAGEALRAEVNELLRIAEHMKHAARTPARAGSGRCVIASIPLEFAGAVLFPALSTCAEQEPGIDLTVWEMTSDRQMDALRSGRIDIGIVSLVPGLSHHADVESVMVANDALDCALVAANHPLATRSWLTVEDLADVPFVFTTRDRAPHVYDAVVSALSAIGLHPARGEAHLGHRAMWRVAAMTGGWTIGRRTQQISPPAGMVAIPLHGLSIPCGTAVIWRRDESDASVLRVLRVLQVAGGQMTRDPVALARHGTAAGMQSSMQP